MSQVVLPSSHIHPVIATATAMAQTQFKMGSRLMIASIRFAEGSRCSCADNRMRGLRCYLRSNFGGCSPGLAQSSRPWRFRLGAVSFEVHHALALAAFRWRAYERFRPTRQFDLEGMFAAYNVSGAA